MTMFTPEFAQAAISETSRVAQQRIEIDQSWQECFDSLRQYGAMLPPEFADTRARKELGSNQLLIPNTEDDGVNAVRFGEETVIGFMANQFLVDRKHTLVVPDNPEVDPVYTTWVVNCDIQCVPIDPNMRFGSVEEMKFCPDTVNINRRQRTANAIGHMLYALSPENGIDGQEKVRLNPGRIIAPIPPNQAKLDKIYKETLKVMAILR